LDSCRNETAKKKNESVGLDDHANQRIADENYDDASEEGDCRLDFMFLKEKTVCALESNYTRQTADEQNLKQRKTRLLLKSLSSQLYSHFLLPRGLYRKSARLREREKPHQSRPNQRQFLENQ
jgi:hypothetical protein